MACEDPEAYFAYTEIYDQEKDIEINDKKRNK